MGKLIAVVGNSGVGKTTLTRALVQAGGFVCALEQHDERPFHAAMAHDRHRYGLANQIDFLLHRAEQERWLRDQAGIGIQDGGLDLDYQLFSRRFAGQGYLSGDEHALCARLYTQLRACLPPPDLIIHLSAPLEVIARRYSQRRREVEIASLADLASLDSLLHEWLATVDAGRLLTLDASEDNFCAPAQVAALLAEIATRLA